MEDGVVTDIIEPAVAVATAILGGYGRNATGPY